MAYIVCEKRRGHPKVNVEVCRRKCKFTEDCKSYRKYLEATALEEPSLDVEKHVASPPPGDCTGKAAQVA
jgi:hypothetical protein